MPRQPCIECWCARVVKRGVEKPEVARGWNLKRLYGIGVAEYEAMFTSQGGVCAICGNPPSGNGSRQVHLHVDHDHSSGKIRQLLCHKCNMGLGAFGDDVDLLRAAVEYLIKWGD